MKKSEAIELIRKEIIQARYQDREDDTRLCYNILLSLEKAGMVPPETNLINCPDPDFQIWSGDSIDIPHWIIHGWDNE